MKGKTLVLTVVLVVLAGMAGAQTAGEAESVRISTVRFIIDEVVYSWRNAVVDGPYGLAGMVEPVPQPESPGLTAPAVLVSYIDFRPGLWLDERRLEHKARLAQRRLEQSGLFMTAQVLVLPSSRSSHDRMVLIEVREAGRWRFGGGNAFAMVGMGNVGGLRRSWQAVAGYNLAALGYRDELVFGLPLEAGAGLSYENSLLDGKAADRTSTYHEMGLELDGAWRPHPDWWIGLALGGAWRHELWHPELSGRYPQGWRWLLNAGLVLDQEQVLSGPGKSLVQIGQVKAALEWPDLQSLSLPVSMASCALEALAAFPWLSLAAGLGAAWASGPLPPDRAFDLGAGAAGGIRSAKAWSQRFPDAYAAARLELRAPAWRFFIPPFFNTYIEPFLLAEAARAWRLYGGGYSAGAFDRWAVPETGNAWWLEGFGGGVRFGFAMPVNVHFTLSAATNRYGAFALTLAAGSAGFITR